MFKNAIFLFILMSIAILSAESSSSIAKEYSQKIVNHFEGMKHRKYLIEHEIGGRHYLFIADRGHHKPKAGEITKYVIDLCVPDQCELFLEGSFGQLQEGIFGLEDQLIAPLVFTFAEAYFNHDFYYQMRSWFPYLVWTYPKLREWWEEAQINGFAHSVPDDIKSKVNALIKEAEGREPLSDLGQDPILIQARQISIDEWFDVYQSMLLAAYADPDLSSDVAEYLRNVIATPRREDLLTFYNYVNLKVRSYVFVDILLDRLNTIPNDKLIVVELGFDHYFDVVRALGGEPLNVKMPSGR